VIFLNKIIRFCYLNQIFGFKYIFDFFKFAFLCHGFTKFETGLSAQSHKQHGRHASAISSYTLAVFL